MSRTLDAPTRGRGAAVATSVLIVLGAAALVVALLLRGGGGQSDEQAVRAWFQSSDGGSAPSRVVSSIHVGACSFTGASVASGDLRRCEITTDAPATPTLHTCFVFSSDSVVRGGWQLAKLDACNALRFDGASGDLVDLAARAHYALAS